MYHMRVMRPIQKTYLPEVTRSRGRNIKLVPWDGDVHAAGLR